MAGMLGGRAALSSEFRRSVTDGGLAGSGGQVFLYGGWYLSERFLPGISQIVQGETSIIFADDLDQRVQPDTLVVYLATSAGQSVVQGTTVLPRNEWLHAALTYDGVQARIFVNGVLDVALDVSGEVTQSDNELRIGRGEPAGCSHPASSGSRPRLRG